MSLRIGLLQCDHVADDLIDTHSNYPEIFEDILLANDPDIEMAVYDLTSDRFPVDLNACDGYLITGSQFSAYDDIPWIHKAKQLIKDLYDAGIPTVGICFGHQLIAEALGGKVEKATDKGWGVGVHSWNLKEQTDWTGDTSPESFSLRVSHQDQVTSMPPEAKVIASSDFCPIAGFQSGHKILSFQGHPEFTAEYAKALINKRIDRIGEAVSNTAIRSLKNDDVDADMVTRWMINFFKLSIS